MKLLSDKEKSKYDYYKKHWGEARAKEAIIQMRAYEHLKKYFECVPNDSYANMPLGPNRGYVNGKRTYRKVDGSTVTKQDIEILKNIELGQITNWRGTPGEKTIIVTYTCDSTD